MKRMFVLALFAAAFSVAASASATVGTSFPAGFPVITDASVGTPVLGFGAAGPVHRTPVIFLHGNNDTPFPTACNPFYGNVHDFARFFEPLAALAEVGFILFDRLALVIEYGLAIGNPAQRSTFSFRFGLDLLNQSAAETVGVLESGLQQTDVARP